MSDSSMIVQSAGIEIPSGESILSASPVQEHSDVVVVAYQTSSSNALDLVFVGSNKAPTIWHHPHLHVVIKNDKPSGFCRKPDALILNCGERSVGVEAIGGKNSGASTSVAPCGDENKPWVQAVWGMLGFNSAMRNPHYEPVHIHAREWLDSFLATQPTGVDRCVDDMLTAREIGPKCHAQIKQYITEAREFYRTMVVANRKVIGDT